MSPMVVGQDARAHTHNRRDRQVRHGPPDTVAAICGGEPWRHCGKPGRSPERPMSTLRHSVVLRLALLQQSERLRSQRALIAWRQNAGSSAGGQGRKPTEPVARSASLDRLTRAGIARPSDHGPVHQKGHLSGARCAGVASPIDFASILDRSDTLHLGWCREGLQKPMFRQSLATRIYRSDIVAFILPSLVRRFGAALDRELTHDAFRYRVQEGPSRGTTRLQF